MALTTSTESRSLLHWIAAGLGSGWLPKAPGTWGSLAALLPAWLILEISGGMGLLIASILMLFIGCWVCSLLLPQLSDKDPAWIVIDEWAGQWLCLALLVLFLGPGFIMIAMAFIAFRLFDIFKPWPISLAERLGSNWWSIMADDIVAGLIGAIVLIVIVPLLI